MKARHIGPYRYQLPIHAAAFLTEKLICTIFPKTVLVEEKTNRPEVSIVLVPEDIWINGLRNKIELLNTKEAVNRQFQRLAISYSEQLCLVNGILDLSNCLALIEFAELHKCIVDDDMSLSVSKSSVIMKVSQTR